ncbi:hypothetical protein ACWHA1_01745 [Streptomyces decoyicus]
MSDQEVDSRDIPDYRALVVIDMKGYSKVHSHLMPAMRDGLDSSLATAFAASGLGEEWEKNLHWSDTGDGCILVMPVRRMWRLVDPLPDVLDGILARYDAERLASTPEIRVRMSVHVGPLPESFRGDAINDACRLIDSDAARDAVDRARDLGSYVALVISEPVFQAVVRPRRTIRITEHDFMPARAEVKNKYSEAAWVHIPRRSPLAHGTDPGATPAQPSEPPSESFEGGHPGATNSAASKYSIGSVGNIIDSPATPFTIKQSFKQTGQ